MESLAVAAEIGRATMALADIHKEMIKANDNLALAVAELREFRDEQQEHYENIEKIVKDICK